MVCFSLGSNLGDRISFLQQAIVLLTERVGLPVSLSSVYETEPWGVEGHQNYLNAVAWFNTILSPKEVLVTILNIEKQLGRIRVENKVEPRNIDIDILFYDDIIINKEGLVIPHPFIQYRKFVLVPLTEISGGFMVPGKNATVSELLNDCNDSSTIIKTELSLQK